MGICAGFSLTEVLVSLLLVTSSSLALLNQLCHVSQLTNQLHLRNFKMLQSDNAFEQRMAVCLNERVLSIASRVDS